LLAIGGLFPAFVSLLLVGGALVPGITYSEGPLPTPLERLLDVLPGLVLTCGYLIAVFAMFMRSRRLVALVALTPGLLFALHRAGSMVLGVLSGAKSPEAIIVAVVSVSWALLPWAGVLLLTGPGPTSSPLARSANPVG